MNLVPSRWFPSPEEIQRSHDRAQRLKEIMKPILIRIQAQRVLEALAGRSHKS